MDTATKLDAERFAQGMTIQEFADSMQKNRDVFDSNYSGFELQESDRLFFQGLSEPLNVMVLAEDWCGDVLRYLPVFRQIAELASCWEVRVFRRDENPDLALLCLKEGKYRAIPVFKFFDAGFGDRGCFIEKPATVYVVERAAAARFAAEHPDLPDAAVSAQEMSEETRALYAAFMRGFRAEQQAGWQQLFVDAIREQVGGQAQQ